MILTTGLVLSALQLIASNSLFGSFISVLFAHLFSHCLTVFVYLRTASKTHVAHVQTVYIVIVQTAAI